MSRLEELVAAELAEDVDPRAAAMAAAIAARHGEASRAVLFYGSCLRSRELDGLMLDFYLLVADYRAAYPQRWLATANSLIPPNVFPFAHDGLVAKYAVLSEADFRRECSPGARSVSVWARFAQPSRLVWAKDPAARDDAARGVARAAPTLLGLALPMTPSAERGDSLAIWKRGFSLTYAAELRAEREDRSAGIVDADPERYRWFGDAALAEMRDRHAATAREADALRRWRALRRRGKLLSVLRLAKASFTFAGGIDYLAWKINRHAGTRLEIKPWQRRFPLAAAVTLLPRLLAQRAIR